MKEEKKSGLLPILGLIGLIILLFVGIKLVFAWLGAAMPKPETEWEWLTNQGGQETAYALRLLSEEERQSKEIQRWLSAAEEQLAEAEAPEDRAFWLYRQDQDQYVLYLPGQDRLLTSTSITATEERGEDGEYTLVLRARTPEESEEVVAEEQLLCFATQSESWRGIRIRVILDGREQEVYKLVSKGDGLYSTEEVYIGRF
ncbi:MAG: hypothetical protein ACOX7N_07110 [Lawsonibacter sp.]